MSLVGMVSNTSKDVVGLSLDLHCDTPVTLSPSNNVTCSAFLFNSSMGKDCCSQCHLPTSGGGFPARVAPGTLKIPVSNQDRLLCCSLQLNSALKHGAVFEGWGLCLNCLAVPQSLVMAFPPFQPAEELCCLARPVPAWISGSHAWLS